MGAHTQAGLDALAGCAAALDGRMRYARFEAAKSQSIRFHQASM